MRPGSARSKIDDSSTGFTSPPLGCQARALHNGMIAGESPEARLCLVRSSTPAQRVLPVDVEVLADDACVSDLRGALAEVELRGETVGEARQHNGELCGEARQRRARPCSDRVSARFFRTMILQ